MANLGIRLQYSPMIKMSSNSAIWRARRPHSSTVALTLLSMGLFSAGCSSSTSSTTPSPTTAAPAPSSCVSLSPARLAHSYDPVKVTWHQSVNDGDTIDFVLESTSDPFQGSAFRILLSALNGTNEYTVNLVNPRGGAGYKVSYRTADGDEVCSTDLAFAQGEDEPAQAYLTVFGDDSLQVNWVSASSKRGEVLYKTPGTTTWTQVNETSPARTYKAQEMCNPVAIYIGFRDPGFFHSVTILNLESGSEVRIRQGASESRSFTPHPRILAGDASRHSVALFGDLGVDGGSIAGGSLGVGTMEFPPPYISPSLAHLKNNNRIRLTMLYGDLSYANGYGMVWDQFGAQMEQSFAMRAPFVTSVGNHEYVSTNNPKGWYPDFGNYNQLDSSGECGIPFAYRYAFRDGSEEPRYWYSFDYGLVHYSMMSTEHNWLNGSDQHRWLEDDLANVDREKTPWVIVTGHRPMYQTCKGFGPDQQISDHLISDVAPVLRKHHVDVFVAGHYHLYERTAAIDGIVHVLAGSPRFIEGPSCARIEVPWYRKGLLTHGYVELDVVDSSVLNFTYWSYNSTINAVTVADNFQVRKAQ